MRKLVEKGGANGLRPCRGAGNTRWAAGGGSGGAGTCWGTPTVPSVTGAVGGCSCRPCLESGLLHAAGKVVSAGCQVFDATNIMQDCVF